MNGNRVSNYQSCQMRDLLDMLIEGSLKKCGYLVYYEDTQRGPERLIQLMMATVSCHLAVVWGEPTKWGDIRWGANDCWKVLRTTLLTCNRSNGWGWVGCCWACTEAWVVLCLTFIAKVSWMTSRRLVVSQAVRKNFLLLNYRPSVLAIINHLKFVCYVGALAVSASHVYFRSF